MDSLKKINYIFTRKQKINFCLLMIIIIIGSIFELAGVALVQPLVDIMTNPGKIGSNEMYQRIYLFFNLSNETEFIILFILGLIFVYCVKNLYLIFMYNCQFRFTQNNKKRIAMKLMRSYMSQPYVFHLSKNISELQRNMREDVDNLFVAVLAVVQLASEVMTCSLLAAYLLLLDMTISLGVLSVLLLFTVLFIVMTKKKSVSYGERRRDAVLFINKWTRQSFEGVKEIKIANKEEMFTNNVDEAYDIFSVLTRKQEVLNVLPRPLFEAISVSALLGVVGIKVGLGKNIGDIISILSAFAVAAFRILPSFGRLTSYLNNITFSSPSINSVYLDLKEINDIDEIITPTEKVNKIENLKDSIRIQKVTFSYPGADRNVLENVSIDIPKAKTIALIGSSGAGKSTLADIMLGLLEPNSGNVLIDGKDIRTDLYGWHLLIGFIPQTIYLLDDTIRDNILFGSKEENDEKVWEALERAQLAEFVKTLEDGLDTMVGERGIRLSGGQRQRIGIARALYLNPQIIVFDEATSSLDNETETAVMNSIDSLKENHTMIIIAHRLTTIKNCDEIYEIKNGRAIKRDKNEVLVGIV